MVKLLGARIVDRCRRRGKLTLRMTAPNSKFPGVDDLSAFVSPSSAGKLRRPFAMFCSREHGCPLRKPLVGFLLPT
jgi:hypothetical protein